MPRLRTSATENTTVAAPVNAPATAPAQEAEQTVTIDGKVYSVAALNETARQMLVNISLANQEITRQQALLGMLESAKAAYTSVLVSNLP